MRFRALKLSVHIFRVNLGIRHFAFYGLYNIFVSKDLREIFKTFLKRPEDT